MVATLQQIIGKINPWLYAENSKELLKKYKSADKIPAEKVKPKPVTEHTLTYDSASETLEPVYFWILDLMNDFNLEPQKYIDTFSSSPGSGHFGELGQRLSIMQQQGSKIMADIGVVMKSVLNIIYDLKEFRIRLEHYDGLKLGNDSEKQAALLAMKQIWMDKVDATKGNSSIKAMALGQAGFQTLIDAFLIVKNAKDVDKLDLNDRVKRILKPRVQEFLIWVDQSEKELRKRNEIEKTYLKSQVNNLKLYSRWAKPYLKAAQQLEMKDMGREPALVKAFNTILLELSLMGKLEINVKEAAIAGNLPSDFKKANMLKTLLKRKYYNCILIDFKFRGIPQKLPQQQYSHYTFGGRAEIVFQGYALNDEEIEKIDKELDKSDVGDVLRLIEGSTSESLEQLQEEINFFLEEKEKSKGKKNIKEGSNPFLALIGYYNKSKKSGEGVVESKSEKNEKEENKPIKKDTWIEAEHIRPLAAKESKAMAFRLFEVYKKAHGMPAFDKEYYE